jgi:hypothetical protein
MSKILFLIIIFISLIFFQGCSKEVPNKLASLNEYQALFLTNGQVFYAKIVELDKNYLLLKDVFYIQSQMSKESKEMTNILIKRGGEWHKPDLMYLNTKHILAIESVSSDSRVANLIKEAKETQEKK